MDIHANAGRLAGFVLTAVNRPDHLPPTLVAMQTGMCSERACRPTAPYTALEYVDAHGGLPSRQLSQTTEQITLPAGHYIVRAISDGAPVSMTLRLHGLSGVAAIRLTKRHPVVLRTDVSPPGAAGVDPFRNVAVTHDFQSDLGFMMDVILRQYEPHVRSVTGVCLYRGDAKPATGRYHPGCPGGEAGRYVDGTQPTLHYYGGTYGAEIALTPGPWTRGYYSIAAGGPSALAVVSLWVDLI